MTQRYSVSGDPNPDCTVADTGPPAGTVEGKPYWEWTTGARTWRLQWGGSNWGILNVGGDAAFWAMIGPTEPPGEYAPITGTTGNPIVAEYVEPPPTAEKFLTLQVHTGPFAGEFIVLRTR